MGGGVAVCRVWFLGFRWTLGKCEAETGGLVVTPTATSCGKERRGKVFLKFSYVPAGLTLNLFQQTLLYATVLNFPFQALAENYFFSI